jgi:guanylate kinase
MSFVKEGGIIIISAPSGGGKTTLVKYVLNELSFVKVIPTCTTRKKREGEVDGVDYIFLTEEEFRERIKKGEFLEYAVVHGRYYGTLKEVVFKELKKGYDVILVIDVQGMKSIKEKLEGKVDITTIFIIPPSIDELINRLKGRGETEEEIERRLKSLEKELPQWRNYDYIIVNDDLEKAKKNLKSIIISQRLKTKRFNLDCIKDKKMRRLMANEEIG